MYKKVILDSFKKVKKDHPGTSSKSAKAEALSEILMEDLKYQLSGKTLGKLYDEAQLAKKDIQIKTEHINNLCNYLGYRDYNHYLRENRGGIIVVARKNWISIVLLLAGITIALYFYSTRARWMKWEEGHYVEVKFDAKLLQNSLLKFYKKERIENFKKIEGDCSTEFFNKDGSVKVWYYKIGEENLELFSDMGKHPLRGKPLKPITEYMIKTHICPEYQSVF